MKKEKNILTWDVAYRQLAELLYQFYQMYDEEAGNVLYKLCDEDTEFKKHNLWIRKFKSKWKVESIDPVHVFASLNSNRMNDTNRIIRLQIFMRILNKLLNLDTYVYKKITFKGCPAPMISAIMGAREAPQQRELWIIFGQVMRQSQDAYIDFRLIDQIYGLAIASFTIFLFWIDAKNFISLDKNTDALLRKYGRLMRRKSRFTYNEYLRLLPEKDTNLYMNLVLIAIDDDEQKSLSQNERKELVDYLKQYELAKKRIETIDKLEITSKVGINKNFKIIAIKPLNGCNINYLKTLKENEMYLLDKAYKISENKIEIDEEKNVDIYNQKNINININAIVGKNGTGKSTIVEILFAIINNIAVHRDKSKFTFIENIHVEVFFESIFMYKIVIQNTLVKIFKYTKKDAIYSNPEIIKLDNFDLNDLFYTIGINYSLHALNSTNEKWLSSLFHKNDAYQTPIVIEPFREHGNININTQEELVKQRLLANLLQQEDPDDLNNSPRRLTEFYKAEKLEFRINEKKFEYVYLEDKDDINTKVFFDSFDDIKEDVLNSFYKQFNVDISNVNHTLKDYAEKYILKKLIVISLTYDHYQNDYSKEMKNFNNKEEYFERLYKDTGHITYKLRQAVNFLKYKELRYQDNDKRDIESCSDSIEGIKNKKGGSINYYLPPSFFTIDIILEKGIPFKSLSSGEKQKIYSINSVMYHINNIDSVGKSLIQYKYINIILDEIELYFHPELQRNYISDLIYAISKIEIGKLLGINITFVTHSPFILSDIPDDKILFLDKTKNSIEAKTSVVEKGTKTFGANIHELLINGFFMEESIGSFALKKIREIVKFHYDVMNDEKKLEDYQSRKKEFYYIQKHIGEDYMRGVIKNHLIDIEKKLNTQEYNDKRIEELEKELKKLKGVDI